ncbi:MAG TPA: hypothetical protein VGR81_00700 [Candidatus Acidoferrales bacterium]|nr:hypothetical protein [Candidatus Acidoferrales bacterium]
MKFAPKMFLCAASSLILTAALWAVPGSVNHKTSLSSASLIQNPPQTQSASGTIASFDKSSLTLNVASASAKQQVEALRAQSAKTMTFAIDQNTAVDGALKVGANADVSYRTDTSGNNVAVSVRVSQ